MPARNEQDHLERCLSALDQAGRIAGVPLEVVVVLDSCDDGSAAIARRAARTVRGELHALRIEARSVGTARRVGMAKLLENLDARNDWVSTTDADSVVPETWFRSQLAYRAAGAAMVVGTVHVSDWGDLARVRPHWERRYDADGQRHVHGANLSFRASAYRGAGGFSDVVSDEDVMLVTAFARAGEKIVWATDLSVATSARRIGRAPDGFAGYVNRLAVGVDAAATPLGVC